MLPTSALIIKANRISANPSPFGSSDASYVSTKASAAAILPIDGTMDSCNKHLNELEFKKQIDPDGTAISNLLNNTLHGPTLICME